MLLLWRSQPNLPLLADGIPARVGRLRAYGDAIVPQLAAEVIAAYLDTATNGDPNGEDHACNG